MERVDAVSHYRNTGVVVAVVPAIRGVNGVLISPLLEGQTMLRIRSKVQKTS